MSSRRPRFKPRFNVVREFASRYVVRPFKWFSPRTRYAIGFLLLVITTTLLLINTRSRVSIEPYKPGDVVVRTVIAPADIEGVDLTETEKLREAARQSVLPVFKFDPTAGEQAAAEFRAAWEDLQKQVDPRNPSASDFKWNGKGSPEAARVIIARRFNSDDLARITALLRSTGDGYVYDERDVEQIKGEVSLVNAQSPNVQSSVRLPPDNMRSLSVVLQDFHSRLSRLPGWSQEQIAALASATVPLVRPNLVYDAIATDNRREEAARKVQPAIISLKRNQVVVREGDTVNEHTLSQLSAIRAYGRTARRASHIIGLFFIVAALYWIAWKFTEHRGTVKNLSLSPRRAFSLIGSAIVVETLLMRVGFLLSDSIASKNVRPPLDDPTIWDFAIPFASAALLVALLLDTQLAIVTGLITALFVSLISPESIPMTLYAMVSSAAAVYGIRRYRERQSVTLGGLIVGAVSALMAVALLAFAQQPLKLNTILLAVGCGLLGGLLTAVFTAGELPVYESGFGILTDVKLLELSNADLPVLGQLALRAPGTNQHSHAVGQLAEEACRAVGANPLLARIGALYHDIGKLAAPHMFVENQQGDNPHDRLRPTNSARIIISHVTYGQKLAKELGLPKRIADFIPQHHGTRTLHFFLRKAQAQAADNEEVDEKEFRYPGPKPQFKEAAIMMLADSCEAAARSLARPDPDSIRSIVNKIVDAVISDGQLDECDITLREITAIRESITTSLVAIYHARIDYPGFNPPQMTGPLPPLPQAEIDAEERGVSYSRTAEIPINRGGEVEDEAIERKAVKR
ncbi:MAG: HDIG domain-containing protein [Pyrinomonadaceae bacterium]|nr:HDIG domain-containing protein [Pyrinomonadaceae bacterium]